VQLENPRQQRRLNQVIASMPDAGVENLASRLLKFERTLVRQSRHDAEVVEAVVRILEHPAHQRLADKLRHLITKGTTQTHSDANPGARGKGG
jgi:Mn-dependent DtxR family transcriptional regulator